ncbi:hypothetical protein BU26DRAFT_155323 [Trematosphaeria pertusa]|uniref:Zn(2)-C6 fungal-type domain-containing protein n=1 Tax=Trematosphaeria pertusa TaxID=390896 RepID=A0A6A6IYL2_9PLEO|nr:uncharacterized protein BU26DRAFT_155323 [Trematosphaeria pertusa]KAF2255398.1 hypothetical protein BU26DRAFT_155323 [Trematosphaeria pertusa]
MVTMPVPMSALSQGLATEDWQEFVAWDGNGELYDEFFQGDASFASTSAGYDESFTSNGYAQSVTSEQQCEPSSATSIADGLSSFDYVLSAAPSVVGDPSPLGQGHSWLNGSPSTTATSPLVGRDPSAFQGPFSLCEDNLSPQRTTTSSPFFGSLGSHSSYHTASASLFNPHIASSPHAFSNLDVSASQAFSNVGTWVETPIEPIPELDHGGAVPIPIPQAGSQSFSNTFSSRPWSSEMPQQQVRPRAITIPQSNRHVPAMASQQQTHQVPPMLSVSPVATRPPRSAPLSRSISKSEPRRSRNKMGTPSPTTKALGWVSYQPNLQTNRLVASGAEGNRGRRPRGRVGPLRAEQRTHAAYMRKFGSCSNCKRRKERCDEGIPCKSCLNYYKGDLINHPCRDQLLSDLSGTFLAERLGWHPTARAVNSFIAADSYHVLTGFSYTLPLNFGFGPELRLPVHALQVEDADALCHEHVIYSWPPSSSSEEMHTHAVLPAVLTHEAESNLQDTLDAHLLLLVKHDAHFRSFPLFRSPLRILNHVYIFFRSLPVNTPYSHLLQQALKLLVLVHIGGDLTLPPPSTDLNLAQLVRTMMTISDAITPTPCFIRAQFGSVMPLLALRLMKEVLLSLEQLVLNRECHEWPFALATLIVVLMTVESIQYHAAKRPYHDVYGSGVSRSKLEQDSQVDDEGVESLLKFYSACYPGCHARLNPEWQGESSSHSSSLNASTMNPEDRFVENVREAAKRASPGGYLDRKASEEKRVDEDMGFFFDRLVARLLVMKT